MANKHANLEELFSAIADAIRVADDKIVGTLVADDFPEIISNIESGVNTDDADAEEQHIQIGKIAYVKGERIEGTLNPSPANIKTGVTIAGVTGTYTKVDSNAAAAANIETGKIAFVNGSQITGNLPNNVTTLTFSAATNNTSSSAIAIQSKHSSKFICNANTNMTTSVPYANIVSAIGLTAAKIADGEYVLGVTGTYTEESTSVAATAAQIQKDKVAYVNGARLVGTLAPAANTIKSGTTIAGVPGTLLATSTGSLTGAHILSGYKAYNSAGTLLTGTATAGLKVATGTISGNESSTFTISGLDFTPKGFMFATRGVYFDSYWDIYCLYAFNTTSVSGYYKEGTLGNPAAYASNWSPTGGSNISMTDLEDGLYNLLADGGLDIRMSALYYNDYMAYDASYYGASGYYAEEFFTGAAFRSNMVIDMEEWSLSGTASYTSGTVTVTLDDIYEWMNGYYVAWG